MISKSVKKLKRMCKTYWLIENYQEAVDDTTQLWVIHHRREVQDGFCIWKREELVKIGQYYHLEPNELIFMKKSEHVTLHNNAIDPKTKKPCCYRDVDRTGEKNPMYGKHLSEETKRKLSDALKGHNFQRNEQWIKSHSGENNVSKRKDVRDKLSKLAKSRYKIVRDDGTWYWGHH